MNKEKIILYIEDLENKAKQSDKYFIERNELFIENQQLKEENEYLIASDLEKVKMIKQLEDRIDKAIECMNNTFNITSVKDMINIMNKIEEILKGDDNA